MTDIQFCLDLETKPEALEAALASPPPRSVVLLDDLALLHRERIADLAAALEDPLHFANAPKAGAAGAAGLRCVR